MASKDHTAKLTAANEIAVSGDARKSLQSDLNTYGVKSTKENEEYNSHENSGADDNCFVAGTFAAEPTAIHVEQVD